MKTGKNRKKMLSDQPLRLQHNVILTFTALFLLSFVNMAFSQPPSHDPSRMIRNNDGRYWIFTTGQGVWCMSSSNTNFSDWRAESTPFGSSWPSWIRNYVTNFRGNFWAPDVIKMNSKYYLYYSCAGDGAPAAIGVTTATNLTGPWTDQGMVVAGNNAIDPSLLQDGTNLWMTWGNWVGGIDLCQLSTSTGKRLNSTTYHLVSGEVEGPCLIKNGGYYYLFYQRGLCCNGVNSTYYVVVARSSSVTGPYTGERVFLPNRDGRYIGPGHIGYGEGKLTYHFYDGNDNGNAKLMITTLGWVNGWPVAGASSTTPTGVVSGGTYRMTPRHSGKAVDVQNCGTANGTNVRQWSWLNNTCQQWVFTDAGNGTWRISPANATGTALDVTNCSGSNNANIQLWSWLNNNCQKWQLVDKGGGYYQIRSVASGKCLDVASRSTADGANIIQYTCGSGYNQQFSFSRLKSTESYEDVLITKPDETEIFVYPNPSDGNFMINTAAIGSDNRITIKIMDFCGKMVYHDACISNGDLLSIQTDLRPGSYILFLEHEKGTTVNKLLIR
ncbi:MAG: family 43 glycosylhydrolase [Bacteroidales bacterium]|nr:family 43 glycosylhydrolase [Bacteroidales bacterium]MBN2762277.1 family 43 glycosylhydrolase [Bacteroidales bacterium]